MIVVRPRHPPLSIHDAMGLATDAELAAVAAVGSAAIPMAQRGAANGVATLGADAKIPGSQLPALAIGETFTAASQAAMLALVAQRGDVAVRTDLDPDGFFLLTTDSPGTLADWVQVTAPGAVLSVNTRTGAVTGLAEQSALTAETTRATAAEGVNASAITTKADAAATTAALAGKQATIAPGTYLVSADKGAPNGVTPNAADGRAVIGGATQGLYARTKLLGDGGTATVHYMAKEIVRPTRIWGVGNNFAQVGFSDDFGATWTPKFVAPDGFPLSIIQLAFSATYMWMLTTGAQNKTGHLYRSPLPDASGNGVVWTQVFDLATAVGGANSGFLNGAFATSEPYAYLVEYSGAPVTGGPSCYRSSDNGATWVRVKQWAGGKHCHAVKVIGGAPWVMIGDQGAGFENGDIGLWAANDMAAATWLRRNLFGEDLNGNKLYGINFMQVPIGGFNMIVVEYDGASNLGLLLYPDTNPVSGTQRQLAPMFTMPAPHIGSHWGLTLTSEGNIMWLLRGEAGAIGPTDSMWIARTPFDRPVLLETIALNNMGAVGAGVEAGDYVFMGDSRIRKEKFVGQ